MGVGARLIAAVGHRARRWPAADGADAAMAAATASDLGIAKQPPWFPFVGQHNDCWQTAKWIARVCRTSTGASTREPYAISRLST